MDSKRATTADSTSISELSLRTESINADQGASAAVYMAVDPLLSLGTCSFFFR